MKKIFISFFIFISLNLYGINFNWYWGIQRRNNLDSFLINFLPEYHNTFMDIKLELPVEIKSNFKVNTYNWNSNSDIIPKLEYLKINFYKNFSIKFKPIKNFSLANNGMFYRYSNYIFYPDNKYINFLSELKLKKFFISGMIDNVQKFNFSNLYIAYDLSAYYKFGLMWTYSTINGHKYNFLFNYSLLDKKKLNIKLQNNFIACSGISENLFVLQSGAAVNYYSLKASMKIKSSLNTDYLYTVYDAFYLSNNKIINEKSVFITSVFYNFFNIFSFEIGVFNYKYANTFFQVKSENKFFSIIKVDMSVHNRNVKKWYNVFKDTDRYSIMDLKFSIPLSENLYFNFNYIKHFKEINREPLRVMRLYSEFKF